MNEKLEGGKKKLEVPKGANDNNKYKPNGGRTRKIDWCRQAP